MKAIDTARSKIFRTITVPDDLSDLTTRDAGSEGEPAETGMTPESVAAIWASVEELYRTGIYPGISLCLRRHGRVVLNRAIGHSHGNGPGDTPDAEKILMTPDTPVCQYSASKAVTAMLIHLLVERGALHLTDPVAYYIPEFAAHGKQNTTIYHLISHHGGIPTPPPGTDPEYLFDPGAFVKLICNLKPASKGGRRMAYHAITGGAILGEIVRRVTGKDLREFLRETIQEPLGFRYFNYGVDDRDIHRVAVNYDTGLPLVYPISALAKRALSVPWGEVVRISNEPRFMQAIIPAANLVATANEMSMFFQLLLNGGILNGVRICKPITVRRAVTESGKMTFDGTMVVPMRYSAGFMLGANPVGLWGPYSEAAYGHVGFINILCWADPIRDISVSLQTTGKSLIGMHILPLARFLMAVGRHCTMETADGATPDPLNGHFILLQKMLRKLLLGL